MSTYYEGIPELNVTCALWMEYIFVNESAHSFNARYWYAQLANLHVNHVEAGLIVRQAEAYVKHHSHVVRKCR